MACRPEVGAGKSKGYAEAWEINPFKHGHSVYCLRDFQSRVNGRNQGWAGGVSADVALENDFR